MMLMKKRARNIFTRRILLTGILVPVFLCVWPLQGSDRDMVITRFGKRIQLDGFLMEWKESDLKLFITDKRVGWDAMNTSDGIAGYFKTAASDSCSIRHIKMYPAPSALHRIFQIDLDSVNGVPDQNCRLAKLGEGAAQTTVAEFILPWEAVETDSLGWYSVGVLGLGSCSDTIGPLVLRGKKIVASPGILTPGIKMQSLLIVILLVVYVLLYARVRKRMRRKESPRQ